MEDLEALAIGVWASACSGALIRKATDDLRLAKFPRTRSGSCCVYADDALEQLST